MRTASTPLHDYLAAGRVSGKADLWTFRLANGTVLRWTNADVALPWSGNTFALGPGIERGKCRWSLSLDVDELSVTIYPRAADLVGSSPLVLALRRGDFDGASVTLDRAYLQPGSATIVGVLSGWFVGTLGALEGDGLSYTGTVRSPLADLDAPFPRNVVQAQCGNRLFDQVCGLNPNSHRTTGSVTGAVNANRTAFQTTVTAFADGYFTLGRFRWLTGANAGRAQTVRANFGPAGGLQFPVGWPDAVVAGDTFELFAGCDKRLTTCSTKFANTARFRGMPFVPAPETTT